jgi:hypothetical protein
MLNVVMLNGMTPPGQACWATMASTGGKLTGTGYHPTKKSKQSGVTNLSL